MQAKQNIKLLTIVIATIMSPYVYADNAASAIGNGVTSVVGGVGEGVKDVGAGVGNAVTDVGTGVGNAISDDTSKPNNDMIITGNVQDRIKGLKDNNQIASDDEINIITNSGVVTISGTVSNASDIDTIRNTVNSMPGVLSVTIDLKLKS